MEYKAIMAGLFNAMSVNRALRTAYAKINELESRIEALEPQQAETVADESTQTIVDPDVESVSTDDGETVTDDNEQDYYDFSDAEIREQAKAAGIKSWHVKNIVKLKAELDALNED